MKFNVLFILGGPGAGKGTVCEKIVQDHGFMHFSAGELLRQACDTASSEYGQAIIRHMKEGTIVPAEITCGLLQQAMVDGYQKTGCVNYLIDGFPRSEDNRRCWTENMDSKTVLRRLIYLDCPDDICVERCMGRGVGRVDDNRDTLNRRLRIFKEQCLPVIDYYDRKHLVSRIDASKSKEEVFSQLKDLMLALNL